MNPFITVGSRTSCKKCGGQNFIRLEDDEDNIKYPICSKCGGRPKRYRVAFSLPKPGTNGFKKYLKTKNEIGEPLDTLTKAKSFMCFLENKIKLEGINFDPREIGGEEERRQFIVKHFAKVFLEYQKDRISKGELTPGGFNKLERGLRLYIVPLFGEKHLKQITTPLITSQLTRAKISPSVQAEVIKVLSSFLGHAERLALIDRRPTMPRAKREKTFKVDDFYTAKERDLVIDNIKNRKHQIAIIMLSQYVARQSEIRCLRWGDIDLRRGLICFQRHLSEGKTKAELRELKGLKSSPEKVLIYPFFPGLKEMLMELGLGKKKDLVFKGRNGYLGKNALWKSWTNSVDELIEKKKLNKRVDLHRGTRSSTLSDLLEKGFTYEELNELYGGDIRTMEKHYAKKKTQRVAHLWSAN